MRDRPSDDHRRRTEVEMGRSLATDEVVDHVNEDKDDNTPTNRRVMSRSAHTAMHNRARGLSRLRKSLRMVEKKERLY